MTDCHDHSGFNSYPVHPAPTTAHPSSSTHPRPSASHQRPPPPPPPAPPLGPLPWLSSFTENRKLGNPFLFATSSRLISHHSSEIIINKFNIMVLALALKLTNFKLIILDWKSGNVGGNIQHWCSFKITLHSIFKERYVLFKERYVLFKERYVLFK